MVEGYSLLSLPTSIVSSPTVSIICLTYKHVNLIHQSLDGFLMQKTNFDYEILIFDDCSPDNTLEVVTQYINNHPKGYLIKYYRQNQNIGTRLNGQFALKYSFGKYIALCEGDDYWTDELKLQKQVDVMNSSDSIVMSFHNAKEVLVDREKPMIYGYKNGYIHSKDIIEKKIRIPTLSMLFRRSLELDSNLEKKLKSGDRYIEVAAVSSGRIFYFDEMMGVKRTLYTGSLGQWKKDQKKANLDKYNSNVLLLTIIPAPSRKYMHRYLFKVSIQILKLTRFSELRFLPLAMKHFILGL